jgi:hypothetical protein
MPWGRVISLMLRPKVAIAFRITPPEGTQTGFQFSTKVLPIIPGSMATTSRISSDFFIFFLLSIAATHAVLFLGSIRTSEA